MLDACPRCLNQPPLPLSALHGCLGLDVIVDPLPMLHTATNRNNELEAANARLISGVEKVLDHDRGGVEWDTGAKHLSGGPLSGVCAATPEELQFPISPDGNCVEIAPGAALGVVDVESDVGLHE